MAHYDMTDGFPAARGTAADPRFAYIVSDDQMAQGSTLGAPRCSLIIKPTGSLQKVYSPESGFDLFGALGVHYWARRSKVRLASHRGEFHIHPERQDHVYVLDNGVHVHEQIFAYNAESQDGASIHPPAAFYRVHLVNESKEAAVFDAYGFCELRGSTDQDVEATFDPTMGGIVAWNRGAPNHMRLFMALPRVDGWETTDDRGKLVARTSPGALANAAASIGPDPVGAIHVAVDLQPGEDRWIDFVCVLGTTREDLKNARAACPDGASALNSTTAYYWNYLRRSVLRTPDHNVNRGVLWAKANMLRVQTFAPTGWCFTNDPTRSNNSVGRDTAWMAFGADYLDPDFAHDSLQTYFRLQESSGKIVEYYDVRNNTTADYKLNVNDNTPLAVIALWHHYVVTHDEKFLRDCYPGAIRAMEYMLSQRNDMGLVWCTSTATSDWGIIGWRNVIANYRISGASTEVNSECYAALLALSEMATILGDQDSVRYKQEAQTLREAINTHLVNPQNDLYYLTIDVDGSRRSDITSDLVFPVLFGVAPPERAARIIETLSEDAFWTTAGIRTVPRDDLIYGPTNGYGLLGGVWVAVTFWYAFAAAKYNPSFMARALANSFMHFSSDPRRANTVPGQFSEWLHGETLANQGMMLSPWDAPRYLWAAIEGAAGLDVHGAEATINPSLAMEWRWLSACNVPFRGEHIAWIALRMPDGLNIYSTANLRSEAPITAFDADVSNNVVVADPTATVVSFARKGSTLIFVGNSAAQAITTAAALRQTEEGRYTVRIFSTVWNGWQSVGEIGAEALLDGMVVVIDAGGFALIEIQNL